MKSKNIGFGLFLLSIGILWLLITFGIIDGWSMLEGLTKLWPLILIVIGVNVIFKDKEYVKSITWVLFIAAIAAYSFFHAGPSGAGPGNVIEGENFTIEKPSETRQAELNLAVGGNRLSVDAGSNHLVEGTVTDKRIRYDVRYDNAKEIARIDLRQPEKSWVVHPRADLDECRLNLSRDVLWDMEMKVGAVDGSIDLSELKIRNLDVNVGAGKLDFKMGSLYESTEVKIHAGASKILLEVPRDCGVKIKVNGALNNTNLRELGFERKGDYDVSPGYDGAVNKINVAVNMGVGKLDVILK